MALLDEYLVGQDGAWTERQAAHLWRRAGFAARVEERLAAVGAGDQESFRNAVDVLVDVFAEDPNLDAPAGDGTFGGPLAGLPTDNSDEGNTRLPVDLPWLGAHFLYRMIHTAQPFQEQFSLFLHDHLVSEFNKTHMEFEEIHGDFFDTRAACCDLLLQQLALLRQTGLDDYRDMLINITRDPAMLLYLDNYNNGAGEGRAQENYSREIMELFSMGVDNYSEEDVREIARCFTGEGLPQILDPGAPDAFLYGFRPGNHEPGTKRVFGQTVNESFDGQETVDVVDLILSKVSVQPDVSGLGAPYNDLPATAVYMSWKLCQWFVNQNISLDPPDPIVLELADYMRGSDDAEYPQRRYPYDLRACMRRLFLSNFFYERENYYTVVKTPADFVVTSLRLLGVDYDHGIGGDSPTDRIAEMGMQLFQAPNVAGWVHGRPWINASFLVQRYNWLNYVTQELMTDAYIDALNLANGGPLDPDDDAALVEYFRNLLIQDSLNDFAPGAVSLLQLYLSDTANEVSDPDQQFRRKVRGLAYLTMAMPIWQMK